MVYIFLAEGFEEIEALCPIDVLRRAGISVTSVGVTGKTVRGSHGIEVTADITLEEFSGADTGDAEMAILPGGMPGTKNLQASPVVCNFIKSMAEAGKYVAAICAAPSVLGGLGLLRGKRATCYPGFEDALLGAEHTEESVVVDEGIITAKGMGVALPFGLTLIEELRGIRLATEIKESLMTQN